jgi:hypothetical protein
MTINAEDAEKVLNEVAITERKTELYTSLKGADRESYLWGGIWVIGFTAQHFLSQSDIVWRIGGLSVRGAGVVWYPLIVLGVVAGGLLMSRGGPVRSDRDRELGRAIGFTWFSLYAFMGFWMTLVIAGAGESLFVSDAGERIVTAIAATIPMLALVITGLFTGARWLTFEAVFITVMTGIGLLAAGDYFFLYMAVVGGGTQLAVGAAVQVLLRRANHG